MYIGSCSPDKLLWVDHGVENHVFKSRPVGRGQCVPEITVIVLHGDRVTLVLRETVRSVPADWRTEMSIERLLKMLALSRKNCSGCSSRCWRRVFSAFFCTEGSLVRVAAFIKSIIIITI